MTLLAVLVSMMLGFMLGWGAGKIRLRDFLSSIAKTMEQLRAESKVKVMRRDIAKHYTDTEKEHDLSRELSGESMVFCKVQESICAWCQNNNEKDPFAL